MKEVAQEGCDKLTEEDFCTCIESMHRRCELVMLVCYPYTPANRSSPLALARTHFMYVASVDSLHPSSINHTDAHTSSSYTT